MMYVLAGDAAVLGRPRLGQIIAKPVHVDLGRTIPMKDQGIGIVGDIFGLKQTAHTVAHTYVYVRTHCTVDLDETRVDVP